MTSTNSEARVYAGAEKYGLYRLSPGANQWESLTNGLPERVEVQGIALHPDNPALFMPEPTTAPTAAATGATIGSDWTTPRARPAYGLSCSGRGTPR